MAKISTFNNNNNNVHCFCHCRIITITVDTRRRMLNSDEKLIFKKIQSITI